MKERLYCYVDETGQDTQGRLFIVSVVVIGATKDKLTKHCEDLEKSTGKGKFKWGKAKIDLRLRYLRSVCSDQRFHGTLRYAVFHQTTRYDAVTIEAIARALHWQSPDDYSAFVFVDSLASTKCREYTLRLRQFGVSVQKVRGVRKDENHALTRLADAVAGFVRDMEEGGGNETKTLFDEAKRQGFLVGV